MEKVENLVLGEEIIVFIGEGRQINNGLPSGGCGARSSRLSPLEIVIIGAQQIGTPPCGLNPAPQWCFTIHPYWILVLWVLNSLLLPNSPTKQWRSDALIHGSIWRHLFSPAFYRIQNAAPLRGFGQILAYNYFILSFPLLLSSLD